MPLQRVCVYCGSSPGARPAYLAAARAFGATLARRGIGLVYGGASVGLMGAVADGALEGGGEVVGVIPGALVAREIAHRGCTRLEVVTTMHERKARMSALADAVVALPGGLGTLDELFEAWTWTQLGIHDRPLALLEVDGFWAPLLAFLDHATAEGFVRAPHRALLHVAPDGDALLDALAAWTPAAARPWAAAPAPRA